MIHEVCACTGSYRIWAFIQISFHGVIKKGTTSKVFILYNDVPIIVTNRVCVKGGLLRIKGVHTNTLQSHSECLWRTVSWAIQCQRWEPGVASLKRCGQAILFLRRSEGLPFSSMAEE